MSETAVSTTPTPAAPAAAPASAPEATPAPTAGTEGAAQQTPTPQAEGQQQATGQPAEPTQPERRPAFQSFREARKSAIERAAKFTESLRPSQARTTEQEGEAPSAAGDSSAPTRVENDTTQPTAGAEPVVDAHGRKHDPATGKFLPESGEDSGQPSDPRSVASTPPSGDTPADPSATPNEEPQTVRIQLPEGDIRRVAGGLEYIDVPKELEQFVRWNVNNHARQRELAAQQERIKELQQENLRLKAQQTAAQKWQQSEAYQKAAQEYREILDTMGEDAAKNYWRGVQAEVRAEAEREFAQQWQQAQAAEYEALGKRWLQDTYQRVSRDIPAAIQALPGFRSWFQQTASVFEDLDLGADPQFAQLTDAESRAEYLHGLFARMLETRLRNEPAVRALIQRASAARTTPAVQTPPAPPSPQSQTNGQAGAPAPPPQPSEAQQRLIDEVANRAVEAFKRELAERRVANPTHPLAGLTGADRGVHAGGSDLEDADINAAPPTQQRKLLRDRARARGRTLFAR